MPTSQSPSLSPSAFATLDKVAARTPDGSLLFHNLSLTFGAERTGVVGRNGAGKSSLLRLLSGVSTPAEGAVARAGTIGVLDQRHDPAPGETVAAMLGVADDLAVIDRILAGEGGETDLEMADWTLEARIGEVLDQVGLAGLSLERQAEGLSGGEQTRLRLAGLLLSQPDLLLLDEPTNHLDADARRLVASVLDRWSGGAVVVSHDRGLLRAMDRIIEITSLGVEVFGGGYDLYAERKAQARQAAERDLADAEKGAARSASDAQRRVEAKARRDAAGRRKAGKGDMPKILLGARAERAENTGARDQNLAMRQAGEAQTALEAAQARIERVRPLSIPMPPTGLSAGRTVLDMQEASWATPQGWRIVGPISLKITGPERIIVTGPNGAGKSTLLHMVAGDLAPTSGAVERPVRAVLLDQEAAILSPEETLIEAWLRLNPEGAANDAHAALARFLFRNAAAHRRVAELSGGERLRAALACVMSGRSPARFLILDEPTNHLDLESVAAVETALADYDGALMVVSHDPDFIDAIGIERVVAL
nr:ABC-F family ATP-binding cassette domain-containing protein [uncultured Brevundimonas sp.]